MEASDASAPLMDVEAVLAGMQQQIDDLTAAVEAQQRVIDVLLAHAGIDPAPLR